MGVNQFYGRLARTNGQWIDAAPKVYGFALCTYPIWSGYQQNIPSDDYIIYPENNIATAIYEAYVATGDTGFKLFFGNAGPTTGNHLLLGITNGASEYLYYNGNTYNAIISTKAYGYGSTRYCVLSDVMTADNIFNTGAYIYNTGAQNWTLRTIGTVSPDFPINQQARAALLACINGAPGPDPEADPYEGGGNTSIGGGGGDFDTSSEAVNIPSLPTLTISDTGFISLFNPSVADLKNLANYMWTNALFDVNTWKKLFADPMQAILGLSMVPVTVSTSGIGAVSVGNISTNITMPKVSSQYVIVDCGSIQVNEFWGGYLDYAPYTKAEIYLPYCGIHPIDMDDIMNKTVQVVYHIDLLSGACCAFIKCDTAILYSFIGQCSASIPITGDNYTHMINGVLTASVAVGSMIASDGMTAPVSIPQIASTAINDMKPAIEKSGSLSGVGGMLAYQVPYLIITRPRQAVPANQNKFLGYPSYITANISDLRGYTEFESVHLDHIGCTDAELTELENLLKAGVIL